MTEIFALIGTDMLLAIIGILAGMCVGWLAYLSEKDSFFWHIIFAAICIVGMVMLMKLIYRLPFVTNDGIGLLNVVAAWTSAVVCARASKRHWDREQENICNPAGRK